MKDIFAHIRPDTRITWNQTDSAFFVRLENLGMSAFAGKGGATYHRAKAGQNEDQVTIFTPDEETAIRLVSVLLVIRQRITAHRDRVVEKLTNPDVGRTTLQRAREDIARATGASVESVL
jgi:hypothetical protein